MSQAWEAWEACKPAPYAFENVHLVTADERDQRSSRRGSFKRKASDYKRRPKRRRKGKRTLNDERWNMRIPAALAAKLRRLAEAEGVTGSQWVRLAIERAKEPEPRKDEKA